MKHIERWKINDNVVVNGTVTALVGDPMNNATFAVCYDDGTVDYYRVRIVKDYFPPRPPSWGDQYGKPVGYSGTAILVVVVVSILLWRRRSKKDAT